MLKRLLGVLLVASVCCAQNLGSQTCQNNMIQGTGASAYLSGLFAIHERNTDGKCGRISMENMQAFEAIRWALDGINRDTGTYNSRPITDSYVPGIKIGMSVHDTCSRISTAIGGVNKDFPDTIESSSTCSASTTNLFLGIVGASKSNTSMGVNEVASDFMIPQISFSATDSALSDSMKFPTFMRTVPPDSSEIKAVIEFLKLLQWKYIALVYNSESLGQEALEEFRRSSLKEGICVTYAQEVPNEGATDATYDSVVRNILPTGAGGAVYIGTGDQAKEILKAADRMANKGSGDIQWLLSGHGMARVDLSGITMAKGALFMEHETRHLAEFEDHWVLLDPNNPPAENPWFKEWWMSTNNCKLPGTTDPQFTSLPDCVVPSEATRRNQFVQSRHVEPAIHAIYSYAMALRNSQIALCGASSTGVCTGLANQPRQTFFNAYLKVLDFSYTADERISSLASASLAPWNAPKRVRYDANGDIFDPSFRVWNYNDVAATGTFKLEKVASYYNNDFGVNPLTNVRMYDRNRTTALNSIPSTSCPNTPCALCLEPMQQRKYFSSDGDIHIAALFGVHNTGTSPYKCGVVNPSVASVSEAFIYALKMINDRTLMPGILNGITIGGLGLNQCNSPATSSMLVSGFEAGLVHYKTPSGKRVDPMATMQYVADDMSTASIFVANILTYLKKTQVSYASTSTELSDTNRFPYFLRTVPADDSQASAIVFFLKKMGWTYVQTIQSSDSYGRNGIAEFTKLARKEGICVIGSYEYTTDGSYGDIFEKLRKKPEAKVVVTFAAHPDINGLMEEVKSKSGHGEFQFVFSENYPQSTSNNYAMEVDGLIHARLKFPSSQSFVNHLNTLDVTTYMTNPWFKEVYQYMMNCYLDANDNPNNYPQTCVNPATTPISTGAMFNEGTYSVGLITAVYALAHGVHKTMEHYCGIGYDGMCSTARNAPDMMDMCFKFTEQAMFETIGGHDFKFINRAGNFGYEFLQYQRTTNTYVKVGEYDLEDNSVTVQKNQLKFYSNATSLTSVCSKQCTQCFPYLKFLYQPGDVILGGLFPIHNSGDSPFSCKALSMIGFQRTEVVLYALNKINSGSAPVSLNGVSLGSLMFDDCSSKFRADNMVYGTHSGEFSLIHNGKPIMRDAVHGWMSYGSGVTMSVSEILLQNKFPLISPDATSTAFKEPAQGASFEHVYRTVPADDRQAFGMAKLAQHLRFTYVQTVQAPSLYGRSGIEAFKKFAKQLGICIANSYEITTDGDSTAIVNKLLQSQTRIVVIFAAPHEFRSLLQAEHDLRINDTIVFIGSENWNKDPEVVQGLEQVAGNSLTFEIESPEIAEFTQWLSTKYGRQYTSNPWFEEWYQFMLECNLPNNAMYNTDCLSPKTTAATTSSKYRQGAFTLSTINAVYAYAQALDMVLKQVCGNNYSGLCDNFTRTDDVNKMIVEKLALSTFTDSSNKVFKFIEREGNKGYNIYQYKNSMYNQIGRYDFESEFLTVTDANLQNSYTNVQAACTGACSQCRDVDITTEKFSYIPGDLLIGGMFDIHNQGDDAFKCGSINNKYGFQLLEAFNYAIDTVNSRKGIFSDPKILRGTTLGGIAFDTCKSPTRTGNLLANVHSGTFSLKSTQQASVNPDRIEAYVGGLDSDISSRMAQLLNVMSIPQVSYGSTSLQLSNRKMYPYFFRTVPADDKQARAMVAFLKANDIIYVQVVNSPGSYGSEAAKDFIRIAPLNGICVAQQIVLDEVISAENSNSAASKLVRKPSATFVVVFLKYAYVKPYLEAVAKNVEVKNKFRFFGSDEWGQDYDPITGVEDVVRGSVTTDFETADVREFDQYLRDKTIFNNNRNPWFSEFYQNAFQCNLPGGTGYATDCNTANNLVDNRAYVQDPYVLYVINAVYATALGVHNTLTELCGSDYNGPCEAFRISGERRNKVLTGISKATFIDSTEQVFKFEGREGVTGDLKRESSRGYHIYSIDRNTNGARLYFYKNIGSYNDTDRLKINSNYELGWSSNCKASDPSDTRCEECPAIVEQPTRFMQVAKTSTVNLLGFFDIHDVDTIDSFRCGKMRPGFGFQNMLAFFYAIEKLNNNAFLKLAPSVKLGGLAIDTCSSTIQTQNDLFNYLEGRGICGIDSTGLVIPTSIRAIIPMTTDTTVTINPLAKPKEIPMLSPAASSDTLSNTDIYTYFARTVPPDSLQAEAIADILKKLGYDYFQVINTNNDYGNNGINKLLKVVQQDGVSCVAKRIVLPENANQTEVTNLVTGTNGLEGNLDAKVVVIFTTDIQAGYILQALQDKDLKGKFLLIGSDFWADNPEVTNGREDIARGSITLKIRSDRVPDFITWVTNLNFANMHGIPSDWFEEWWQHVHKCRDPLSKFPQTQYPQLCDRTEVITENKIDQNTYVYHTIIAVTMIAKAINDVPQCQKDSSINVYECVESLPKVGQEIFKQLLLEQWQINFNTTDFTFKFTTERYGDVGYYIYNFVKNSELEGGRYVKVSSWSELLENFSPAPLVYNYFGEELPGFTSSCPAGKICNCIGGTGAGGNGTITAEPPVTDRNRQNLMACPIEDVTKEFREALGIFLTAVSAVGAVVCFILLIYLCIAYPYKGGTTILGYIILFGVLCLYALNIAFIFLPTFETCIIRRFCLGLVYAIIFAPMLLKVLNAWRVGDDEGKYKRISTPLSFFFIALGMILVQVIIGTEWLILQNPTVDYVLNDGQYWCQCSPHMFHNEGLVLSTVYVMVLIFLTTVFGFVTWDNESNHRESRWVLIATLFTIGCWIVWTIVSTMTPLRYRDPAIYITNAVNATIVLVCIFFRKLWLLNRHQQDLEEERRSQYAASKKNGVPENVYDNVYHNQSYDRNSQHSAEYT